MSRSGIQVERFWSNVDKSGECWLWTSSISSSGYGRYGYRGRRAHRIAWELTNGPIPGGLFACHKCDNRICVNPSHLFIGTAKDNVDDMCQKGRHRSGGVSGIRNHNSKLTERDAIEIIKLRKQRMTVTSIASMFGVSYSSVYQVIRGWTWCHATGIQESR